MEAVDDQQMATGVRDIHADVATFESLLGQTLLEGGTVDAAALERVERVRDESNERLDRIFSRLGIVGERDIAETVAGLLHLDLVEDTDFPDFPQLPEELAAKFIRHAQLIPLDDGETVRLAMADPLDLASANAVSERLGRPVTRCVAIGSALENAIERLYGEGKSSIDTLAESLDETGSADTDADIARLRDLANDAPVIRIVNLLIRKAVEMTASDIHIEPFDTRLRVRFRVDGQLQDVDPPPMRLHAAVLSRIKIMAKLNIAERRLPQDGRIKAVINGKEIDLRVATSPTLHGEAVVLRILDREALRLDFPTLGFDAATTERFRDLLNRPNGIVLVTGPTGSGKTTTLYTAIEELNSAERKIITVEDPVEYQIDGVNQIHARPDIGLSFAHALRSILRQDPDVIMIGEIRDLETAKIAVQAALTGHLVLATLHTNTAAAAVSRLLDMGVEDYLLASTLNGVLAQRLVRKLCPACKTPHPVLPELTDGKIDTAYRTPGCTSCKGRGSQGRSAVLELLAIDDNLRSLILQRADAHNIAQAAQADGMQSMRDNGLDKVAAGICALDDVIRVTAMVQ